MRKTTLLPVSLILIAGLGLGALGLTALSAEQVRIEAVLRQAHTQALQPILDQTNRLFVETQRAFLATAQSNQLQDQVAREVPDEAALALAGELPLVAYGYRLCDGRPELMPNAALDQQRVERILTGAAPARIGKQMQGKLQRFFSQQEMQVNRDEQKRQLAQRLEQTDVQTSGQTAGPAQQGPAQQGPAQQGPAQQGRANTDEPSQRSMQQVGQSVATRQVPVEWARESNWAIELRSFADLVSQGESARFVPLLMGDKLEVLYFQRVTPAAQNKSAKQIAGDKGQARSSGPSGFGFALDMSRMREALSALVATHPRSDDLVTAIYDDRGQLVASNQPIDSASKGAAFVSLELHGRLPRWRLATSWTRAQALDELVSARRWSLGLLLGGCGVALVLGLLLFSAEVRRESALVAKQADFVSNISHELKTPLTSIKMYAELLDQRFGELPKAAEYAQVIGDESNRLDALVSQILDFSRIKRGKRQYDLHPIELSDFVSQIVEAHRPRLEPQGFQLALMLPDEPLRVMAEREALEQILTNLLSNARKYGGPSKRIDISLQRGPDGQAVLGVRDYGQGVPRRWRQRIFDEFVRIDNSLATTTQGSGIGLSLARSLARGLGGELVVSDAPEGTGAHFSLNLPLCEVSDGDAETADGEMAQR